MQNKKRIREKQVNVTLSAEIGGRIKRLAAEIGSTETDVCRNIISALAIKADNLADYYALLGTIGQPPKQES